MSGKKLAEVACTVNEVDKVFRRAQTTVAVGSPNVNDINRFKGDVLVDSIVRFLAIAHPIIAYASQPMPMGIYNCAIAALTALYLLPGIRHAWIVLLWAVLISSHLSNTSNPHNTTLQQAKDVDSSTTRQVTARKFVGTDTSNINAGTINLIRTVTANNGTNNMKGFVDATVWKRNSATYSPIDLG